MLTRRHIRVKVLQSIYAFNQSEHKDLEKQENFLLYNMEQMQANRKYAAIKYIGFRSYV